MIHFKVLEKQKEAIPKISRRKEAIEIGNKIS
jgi:hypothetical protein